MKSQRARAVPCAERLEPAARRTIAAREARDHEAVVVKPRRRDKKAVLPAFRLRRPGDRAGPLIECDELAVQLTDIDLPVAEREPATRPTAADAVVLVVELREIRTQHRAGVDIDRDT